MARNGMQAGFRHALAAALWASAGMFALASPLLAQTSADGQSPQNESVAPSSWDPPGANRSERTRPGSKIGALPAADQRIVRQPAQPLPIRGQFQHVVTTYDPHEVTGPDDDRDYSPDGEARARAAAEYGNLWDYYHGQHDRWWAHVDYLRWRVRGYEVPALVTQSPVGTPLATAGVLPDAQILFGDEKIDTEYRDGARVRLGWWVVDGQFKGYEGEYFGLNQHNTTFIASSTAAGAILARPFLNLDPNVNGEDASLISGTGVTFDGINTFDVDGTVTVTSVSDIQSAGLIRRHVLWADFDRNFRIDYLLGYRYLRIDEGLNVTDLVTLNNPSGGPLPPGSLVRRIDQFDATNDFHGGVVGIQAELHRGRWSVEGMGKLGIGNNHQSVDIDGSLAVNPGGVLGFVPTVGSGGLLAQPGLNFSHRSRDAFTLMPEGEINLVCQLTDWLRANVGYNLIYVNRVVRPGQQVDRNLNPTFFPGGGPTAGAPGPQPQFHESFFWMHGISAGLEARW